MAAALALNSSADRDSIPDTKPTGLRSLWGRVQKVRENLSALSRHDIMHHVQQTGKNIVERAEAVAHNLRHMTRDEKITFASSVAAGLGTKLAITFAVGTGGVGALAVVGTAMATGAAVSLVQSAVTHAREGKSLKSFFNAATLKKVGTSAILAGGTAGWGDVLHNVLGQTVTHALGQTLGKISNSVDQKFVDMVENAKGFAEAKSAALTESLAHGVAASDVAADTGYESFAPETDTQLAAAPDAVQSAPPVLVEEPKIAARKITAEQLTAAKEWAAKMNTPAAPITDPVAAPNIQPDVKTAAAKIGAAERSAALEWAKKMNPTAEFASTPAVSADKVVSLKDVAHANLNNVAPQNIVIKIADDVQLRMPAAPNIAAEVHLINEASLADTPQGEVATELNVNKAAAACAADLPKTNADFNRQNGVLPNTCVTAAGKETMDAGDYVIVRDVAEPNPNTRRGLRVLFAAAKERTTDFIARVVTGETLTSMATEKLADEAATRAEELALAP